MPSVLVSATFLMAVEINYYIMIVGHHNQRLVESDLQSSHVIDSPER